VILLRVLHAEVLKMKRMIALKMVVLSPAVVVLLVLFMVSQAPFSMVHPGSVRNEWMGLARRSLWVWAFLMMPLFITLQTALVAGLDHSETIGRACWHGPYRAGRFAWPNCSSLWS